jgi:hypothetical protein
MCKGSQSAKKTYDAGVGENLGIGVTAHGLASFHPPGVPATECVACVQTGQVLSLGNIPTDLQTKFGIGATAVVTFIQTDDDTQDQVELENRKKISLHDLANRSITAYVGIKAPERVIDTSAAVAGLKSVADAAAKANVSQPRATVDA